MTVAMNQVHFQEAERDDKHQAHVGCQTAHDRDVQHALVVDVQVPELAAASGSVLVICGGSRFVGCGHTGSVMALRPKSRELGRTLRWKCQASTQVSERPAAMTSSGARWLR